MDNKHWGNPEVMGRSYAFGLGYYYALEGLKTGTGYCIRYRPCCYRKRTV